MLRIAICDDNDFHVNALKTMLENNLSNKEISHRLICFTDGEKLKNHLYFSPDSIDLIFMDIKLHALNGINIAKEILSSFPKLVVIFITSHITYARDIFTAKPAGFLVKPIDPEKLDEAIVAATDIMKQVNQDILTLNSKGQVYNLRLRLVDYIISSGRTLTFYEDNREINIYAKLDEIENRIGRCFLRCHKSYMVNMDRIQSFNKQSITLYNGIDIPVSKKRHEMAKTKFLNYLGDSL